MERCEAPHIQSLRLDGDAVVLSVVSEPDADYRCWRTAFAQLSYGRTHSANGYRLRVPDSMRVALRDFRLGGILYAKVRTITADGAVSWWSSPRRIELPEIPDPLPTPITSVEPANYDLDTPWIHVSWKNAGEADKVEVEVYDGEDAFIEGDRTSESSMRYRPATSSSVMKIRVRGVRDGYYSEWSTWGYARRSR